MAGPAVQVEGLSGWLREVRRLEEPKTWTRELVGTHKAIAKHIEPLAQAEARSLGSQQRHFAGAIKGYGTTTAARLAIQGGRKGQRNWGANASTWGVVDNVTGWNRSSTPNLKVSWVGNSWDIAQGQGPTALVNPIVRETPWVINTYGRAFDSLSRRAFPD